ncbi:MAG: 3-phosphoshikimate 1-carboxyvinyltransferase [Candidatus Dormibacteria bacterium]
MTSGRSLVTAGRWRVEPSTVAGSTAVPGDKSIAHRALFVSALAEGVSRLRGLPGSADVAATRACLERLGVVITGGTDETTVHAGSWSVPAANLDAANSGTTMRLLAGLLAAQPFASVIDGDGSLRRRPMERVAHPLRLMGALVETNHGHPPLRIRGGALRGIRYTMPVASAQVKSALLLAGLFAEGETTVVEPLPTRDHTERLLRHAGVAVASDWSGTTVIGRGRPAPLDLGIPGDPSSAAFPLVAAALCDSAVTVRQVAVNPGRIGLLEVLDEMGCQVTLERRPDRGGEPVADVRVAGRPRRAAQVSAERVPSLIDELPLVALLGTASTGTTVVRGAAELRHKESDRIAAVVGQLRRMGAHIEEFDDGFAVRGGERLRGATVDAGGDHRLAMLLAVAGVAASGVTTVDGAAAAAVSFPTFAGMLRGLGAVVHDV